MSDDGRTYWQLKEINDTLGLILLVLFGILVVNFWSCSEIEKANREVEVGDG